MVRAQIVTITVLLGCFGCEDDVPEEAVEDVRIDEAPSEDEPRIDAIEGVDLSRLEAPDRRLWTRQVNDLLSPCGDPISVAECASGPRRSQCHRCLPAARYLARLASEGADRVEMRELYNARYGTDTEVEIDLGEAPVRGTPMGAQVTIVEFSDFQCPHCREAHPLLQRVLRRFEGKVRLVFKNYPLSGHDRAIPAAIAAAAAGRQGKFWEMHDVLFENQQELAASDLNNYAEEIGLDLARFARDLNDEALQRRVMADKDQGRELGVTGTPAIFINNRQFNELPDALEVYVQEELDGL